MFYTNLPGTIRKSFGILGVAQRKQVTLTSAQVLVLNTTPVELIPAPGAGKYIEILRVSARLNFNSVAYTGANALEIRHTNGAGTKLTSDLAAALINSASTRMDMALSVAATMTANANVVAVVPTANPGAGNSTIDFDVLYRIIG